MSWCRWSTTIENGFSSDFYIFDNVDGNITVYVAGRRLKNEDQAPRLPTLAEDTVDEYMAASAKRNAWIAQQEANDGWEDLPEKWARKSFSFSYDVESLDSLKTLLDDARADGLHVAQRVYDIIQDLKDNPEDDD